ncbi:hypothetical protein ACPPVO_59355 [Dactylosporangium sp. McL0621]|uniref:hypothetical protein n=1 Tax=Dactylosporangium sp. McL0621 TaxID=3415678 RepID=UPI003CED05BF
MVTLVTAALVAAVFLRAAVGFVRGRDPLQRDVALIFLPTLAVCANAVFRDLSHRPLPVAVSAVTTALLLLQPYLTLRLAARLGRVPRWLSGTLLVLMLGSIAVVTNEPRPLSLPYLGLVTATFTVTEAIAATILLRVSRRRSGAGRARLRLAAGATYLYPVMMLMIFTAASRYPGERVWWQPAGRAVGLAAALLYLLAFVPPAFLRRIMSATVWYEASGDLQRLPADVETGRCGGATCTSCTTPPVPMPSCSWATTSSASPRSAAPAHACRTSASTSTCRRSSPRASRSACRRTTRSRWLPAPGWPPCCDCRRWARCCCWTGTARCSAPTTCASPACSARRPRCSPSAARCWPSSASSRPRWPSRSARSPTPARPRATSWLA